MPKHSQSPAKTARAAKPAADLLAFASQDLETIGQGFVVIVKPAGTANVETAIFHVDVHLLGVRKVNTSKVPRAAFLETVVPRIAVTPVPPAVARGIIEGAVKYARQFGFPPAPQTPAALALFGALAPAPAPFPFGKNGKPFYTQQRGDDDDFAEAVIAKLEGALGKDGFGFEVREPGEDLVDDDEPPAGDELEDFFDEDDPNERNWGSSSWSGSGGDDEGGDDDGGDSGGDDE